MGRLGQFDVKRYYTIFEKPLAFEKFFSARQIYFPSYLQTNLLRDRLL